LTPQPLTRLCASVGHIDRKFLSRCSTLRSTSTSASKRATATRTKSTATSTNTPAQPAQLDDTSRDRTLTLQPQHFRKRIGSVAVVVHDQNEQTARAGMTGHAVIMGWGASACHTRSSRSRPARRPGVMEGRDTNRGRYAGQRKTGLRRSTSPTGCTVETLASGGVPPARRASGGVDTTHAPRRRGSITCNRRTRGSGFSS